MRNDSFLWYLVGRRRGRREALGGLRNQQQRGPVCGVLIFIFCVLFLSALVYAWAFISAALQRTH